ncbi:MAG: FemAB family XrtA/PEP-CTERM system-associated protein [Planctomycetota bacterium]|jgi:FemAB-related protein (PEP-CTERM system-associated)
MERLTKQFDSRRAESTPGPLVRAWRDGDTAAWDHYVCSHPRATFFHQSGWKRVLEATFAYPDRSLVAERDGRICGVLPLFSCRSLRGGKGLYSLPHTVYGGPLGDDRAGEEALLAAARDLRASLGANALELRNRYAPTVELPALGGFVTFERELPRTREEVYRTFPKKAREMINQATKRHRLTADFASGLDTFYDLLSDSYHALGTPVFPRRFFAAMLKEFPEASSILVVRHAGTPVSTVLSMEFRGTMLPLYSGEAPGVRNLKSNNFKYYRLMEYAVERGLSRFDFGRSRADNEGAVRFKTNQGFPAEPLPYQLERADGGTPSVSSPNRGVFLKARRIWRRLPRGIARRLGPPIVRVFP